MTESERVIEAATGVTINGRYAYETKEFRLTERDARRVLRALLEAAGVEEDEVPDSWLVPDSDIVLNRILAAAYGTGESDD